MIGRWDWAEFVNTRGKISGCLQRAYSPGRGGNEEML